MYKILKDVYTGQECGILRLADRASIPLSEGNTDYQAYLKWLEEGNTPEPADQQGEQA